MNLIRKLAVVIVALGSVSVAQADLIVSYDGVIPVSAGNRTGMAVDPATGHIFTTSQSYNGEDNLYEWDAAGNFVRSTRVALDLGITSYPLGFRGALSKLVVGSNGHLYVHASTYSDASGFGHSLFEISRDGSTVYSQVSAGHYYDIAYDPAANQLFGIGQGNNYFFNIDRVDLLGNQEELALLPSFNANAGFPSGLAYDPLGSLLYTSTYLSDASIYGSDTGTALLVEYGWDPLAESIELLRTFDLSGVGGGGGGRLDYNYSSSLFYAQGGGGVVEYSLDQMTEVFISPLEASTCDDDDDSQGDNGCSHSVPEPGSLALLTLGLLGMGLTRKR